MSIPTPVSRPAIAVLGSLASAALVLALSVACGTEARADDFRPDLNADATHCELVVDDFALVNSGTRGSYTTERVATLRLRAGDDVRGAGVFVAYEETLVKRTANPDGTIASETTTRTRAESSLPARLEGGLAEARFTTNWDAYGMEIGDRRIERFAYWVDLVQDGVKKRLWLKDGASDFTPAAYDADRYFYSNSVFLGGYSSGRYLWRDSGSPLFAARADCAR